MSKRSEDPAIALAMMRESMEERSNGSMDQGIMGSWFDLLARIHVLQLTNQDQWIKGSRDQGINGSWFD